MEERGARGPHARTHCPDCIYIYIYFILYFILFFYLIDFILNYFNCILNN
jgi:hypothetical protein